jgi:hypothetical protein
MVELDDKSPPKANSVDQALRLLDQIEALLAEVRELAQRMKEQDE